MREYLLITETINTIETYLPVRTVMNVVSKENGVYTAKRDDVEFQVPEKNCVEINDMEADIIKKQEEAKSRGIYHWKNYKEFYKKAYGIDLERSYMPDYEYIPKKVKTKKPKREDEGDSRENEIWVQ